jgi:enoyl-CoA hydratase/carnithine racemase
MDPLWLERDLGHARVWTLNRPDARNALSRAARAELEAKVAAVAGAAEVRAVVLTGAGEKAFSAGADLKERAGMGEDEVRTWLEDLRRTLLSIEGSPKVFIAAINGVAMGGGLELALACDLRIAAREAKMGLPEVRLAILPGGGGTQRLPRLIGPGRARDLVLTGRAVGAEEALAMGLVERLAPEGSGPGGALETALALAESLKGCGPLALARAKDAMRLGAHQPLENALETEQACYEAILHTKDRLEGLAAFREKRPPNYRGQ